MAGLFTDREKREFNLSRWLDLMTSDRYHNSLESEMLREAAELRGESYTPTAPRIPFELLGGKRVLTVGGASGGGQFVTESTAAAALAAGGSLLTRLGVPVVDVPAGAHRLPLLPVPTDGQWLDPDAMTINVDQPLLGAVRALPKSLVSLASYSREWARDAFRGPDALSSWLMQMIARSLDKALLTGTGTEGAPLGIANTPGTQSGAVDGTDTFGDLVAIERLIEVAEGRNTAWVASPASKALLRSRALGDGSPIWKADTIDGVPAISTALCPDGTVFCGDWSSAAVFIWNGGVELMVADRGRDRFGSGQIQMRVLIEADVVVARPERLAVAAIT